MEMDSSSSDGFRSTHQEALELDVSVLDALLRYNRCSQRRTKYYQRISMAFRALLNHSVLKIHSEVVSLAKDLDDASAKFKKKRKREQVFWDSRAGNDDRTEVKQMMTGFTARLRRINDSVMALPECLSRLEYAAEALFLEMSRGFFLSFCVVVVGATARIRSLLLLLGRSVLLEQYSSLDQKWRSLCLTVKSTDPAVQDLSALWATSSDGFQRAKAILTAQKGPISFDHCLKSERVYAVLQGLGLKPSAGLPLQNREASPPEQDAKLALGASGNPPGNSTCGTNEVEASDGEEKITALDVGESVFDDMLPVDASFGTMAGEKTEDLNAGSIRSDAVDKNSHIVEALKAENKNKKTESKKRSSLNSERKKKKRKKPKGDFFDNLFG